MEHILQCVECNTYTIQKEHCGKKTISIEPAKYSPDDKYAEMTRKAKEEERKNKGLL